MPLCASPSATRSLCLRSLCSRVRWLHSSGDGAPPASPPAASVQPRLSQLRSRLREEEAGSAAASLASFASSGGAVGGGRARSPSPSPSPAAAPLRAPLSSLPARPLFDLFGRAHTYLRVSLTERCNLRCTYCMPADGAELSPEGALLSTPELLSLVDTFVGLGVRKVRLTGGEPTLRKDLPELVAAMMALRGGGGGGAEALSAPPEVAAARRLPPLDPPRLHTLALTSNGVRLGPLLPSLRAAGLTHVNISLDTLRRERLPAIARRPAAHWDRTWSALHSALAQGGWAGPPKLNVVVMRGVNADELPDFVRLTAALPLRLRFIELMPFAGNGWAEGAFVSTAEQLAAARGAFPELQREPPPGAGEGPATTSSEWRLPGAPGSVGFISPMSPVTCGTCNRLRLTADGNLKVCLHGAEEASLRDVLRAGGDVPAAIAAALARKHAALGGTAGRLELAAAAAAPHARPMVKIGG